MTQVEKLKYAVANYHIGDRISRDGFDDNYSTVVIEESKHNSISNTPHFFGDHGNMYLGLNQIYCGRYKIWAKNLSRDEVNTEEPNYEIY